jgi:Mg-chelatase subunit ChlD
MNKSSSRLVMVAGLFLFAVAWVALMGLVTWLFGGGRATAGDATIDDGSIKAKVTSLDRGKDFEIALAVKATDKAGRILDGLAERDFEVYEDGELVHVQNFMPAGQGAIRLCLVVDCSRSMNGRKIQEARTAARALIRMLRDRSDYLGLYMFNDTLFDRGQIERLAIEPLNLLRRELAWEAIMFTGLGEGSPMTGTMAKGLDNLAKVSGRRVMIVLTDGMDTGEPDEVEKGKQTVIDKALEYRTPLYMVNLSNEFADEQIMRELADKSGGQYVPAPDPSKLKEILETIGKSLQKEYTMTYTSPNPVEDGLKRNVTVNLRSGLVGTQAKGDYNVPGVIATGARRSTTGTGSRLGVGSMAIVFGSLTALLGVMLGFTATRRGSSGEIAREPSAAPAPVVPNKPSHAGVRQPGMKPKRSAGGPRHGDTPDGF